MAVAIYERNEVWGVHLAKESDNLSLVHNSSQSQFSSAMNCVENNLLVIACYHKCMVLHLLPFKVKVYT